MKTRLGRTVMFALSAALAGTGDLAAQQAAGETGPPPALVTLATNLTAVQDSVAGRPRAEAERGVARPGDVLEYRLLFTNPRPDEVRDVVLQNPVPQGMVFVASSAGANRPDVRVEYSIDQGEKWSERPEIEVVLEDGSRVLRPAPPEMYTNVRWTLGGGIAPGAQVQAAYRTRVTGAAPPPGTGTAEPRR